VGHQHVQQVELAPGQLERLAGERGDPGGRIDVHVADRDRGGRGRRAGRGRGPAQHGADARDQLGHAERLHQVVVGAELESDHTVGLLAAGGQHDDRHLRGRADYPADVAAVGVRQAQVEQDDVGFVAAHRFEAVGARAGDADLVALALERRAQRIGDRRLVLDHRHPLPSGGHGPLACRVHGAEV
jgi:hypothetical protein